MTGRQDNNADGGQTAPDVREPDRRASDPQPSKPFAEFSSEMEGAWVWLSHNEGQSRRALAVAGAFIPL